MFSFLTFSSLLKVLVYVHTKYFMTLLYGLTMNTYIIFTRGFPFIQLQKLMKSITIIVFPKNFTLECFLF